MHHTTYIAPLTYKLFCAANMVIFAPLTPLNYDFTVDKAFFIKYNKKQRISKGACYEQS